MPTSSDNNPCKLNTTYRPRYYRLVTTLHKINHNNDRYIACTPINQQIYINNIYTYQDRFLRLYGFRVKVEFVGFNRKRLSNRKASSNAHVS